MPQDDRLRRGETTEHTGTNLGNGRIGASGILCRISRGTLGRCSVERLQGHSSRPAACHLCHNQLRRRRDIHVQARLGRQREVADLYGRATWPPHFDRRVADGLAYNAFIDDDFRPHRLLAVEGLPLVEDTLDQTALPSDMIGDVDSFLQVCLGRQQLRAQGPSPGPSPGEADSLRGMGLCSRKTGASG